MIAKIKTLQGIFINMDHEIFGQSSNNTKKNLKNKQTRLHQSKKRTYEKQEKLSIK